MVGEHIIPCLSAIEVLELSLSSIYYLTVFYDPFGGVPNDVEGFLAPRRFFFLYLQGESFPVFSCRGDRKDAVWQIQHLLEIVAQALSSPSRQSFVEFGVTFRRGCRKDLDMLQHRVGVVPYASDTEHPRMDRKKRKGGRWKKATAPEPQWRKGMEIHARQPLRQSPLRSTRGMRNPTHCAVCQSDR